MIGSKPAFSSAFLRYILVDHYKSGKTVVNFQKVLVDCLGVGSRDKVLGDWSGKVRCVDIPHLPLYPPPQAFTILHCPDFLSSKVWNF